MLAALATISQQRDLLQRVLPEQSFYNDDGTYNGKFKFRFWQYGKWVEVVIDDYLPTRNGKLVFLKSSEDTEFWGALMEKAYGKMYGNYSNLIGGHANEAMVDLTGGTAETMAINEEVSHQEVFETIQECLQENGLLSTSIRADPNQIEAPLDNGLIRGHAYSITGAACFRANDQIYHCIRIRNPWGQVEWTGTFSDNDEVWEAEDFESFNLNCSVFDANNLKNDGEFWMPIEDYCEQFDKLEMCRLDMADFDGEGKWVKRELDSRWSNDEGNAGGCMNNWDTFLSNPFMMIDVEGGNESDECIVALQQKHKRKQKSEGARQDSIGFSVFKVADDADPDAPLTECINESNWNPVYTSKFVNVRDLTARVKLPEKGRYAIVPSTFYDGKEGQFYMRVYVEKPDYVRQRWW